ncbi:hypothetical protein ABZW11_26755 [Nonomuraea sp. NPDC004580]|uniref:hypothetical protein n=1 Tax=Nonomuraea sp. NPDC004580 TaxID=3154552 RepID=UPI0033B3757F
MALLMPPPPPLGGGSGGGGGGTGDDTGDDSSDDGALAPPAPQDPANPTGRELLQVCMAIVTAMGVAAAQALWQRARQRKALADKNDGSGRRPRMSSASHHESGGGSRRRSRSSGGTSSGLLEGGGGGGGPRRRRGRKDKRGHDEPFAFDGTRAPKASKRGRSDWDDYGYGGSTGKKRKKKRKVKGGLGDGACVEVRDPKPRPDGGTKKAKDKAKSADTMGKNEASAPKKTGPKLAWKAPPKSEPGPGGDRALPPGRKRWTSRTGASTSGLGDRACVETDEPKQDGKSTAEGEKADPRLRWGATSEWLRGRRARRSKRDGLPRDEGQREEGPFGPPPPPPPRAEWMRPPPGVDRSVRVESCERVDQPARSRPEPRSPAAVRGAPASGWLQLPAASGPKPNRTPRPNPAPPAPGGPVNLPMSPSVPAPRAGDTQYADADLTVHDVIEADADMADQITEGVDEARRTAEGCERLLTRLEMLRAEVIDLKVPGVLTGMFLRLIDKTLSVKAKAEAIAETLPVAAEAISIAGSNAEVRHKPLADAVKDAGHVRPAEREYHEE